MKVIQQLHDLAIVNTLSEVAKALALALCVLVKMVL